MAEVAFGQIGGEVHTVVLSREAATILADCEERLRKKLERCFASLESNPRSGNNIKALKGKFAGAHRYRVGDYRVVYVIDDADAIVRVVTIAHRGGAYE